MSVVAARTLIVSLTIGLLALTAFAFTPRAYAEPQALDIAGLKQMLENLGYEPTEHAYASGNKYLSIKGDTAGLKWTLDFSLSDDPKLVWATINYWQLKDDQKFPYDVLLKTLAQNDGPKYMHFAYLENARQLRLVGSVINRDLTPADLRKMIDEAVKISSQTQQLWNPNEWPAEAPKAPEDAAPMEPSQE